MPLQASRLALSTLSVTDDSPPTALQPRLPDGIHLRWSFDRAAGFPWYGYYLFRRRHTSGDRPARRTDMGSLVIQPGSTKASTPEGELSSDSSLTVSIFSGSGTTAPGLDLSGRTYLRFVPSELASRVMVRVGLRAAVAPILLTAWPHDPAKGGTPLVTTRITGQASDLVETTVEADGIAAIQISSGDAVLLHLEFDEITDGALAGWTEVPGVPYPLTLPLSHPDYPASVGPINAAAAEAKALARIDYGPSADWAGAPFQNLHGQLVALVQGGPTGVPMAEKATSVLSPPPALSIPTYYSLDLVLVGALHPPVAQMVGLYWVDRVDATKQDLQFRTELYDYLIVAAHRQPLGTTAADALQWLRRNGFDEVDACIVFKKSLRAPAPPLAPPSGLECYALPSGGLLPTDAGPSRNNHSGLRWNLTNTGQQAVDVRSIMYHVWRADLGSGDQPARGNSKPLTVDSPVVVVEPAAPEKLAAPPPDWPPSPLWYLDTRLADGWYGYEVSGVDLFGRHSAASAPGPWRQWTPRPAPVPWYFKEPPAPDLTVHPTAVRLLDHSLPPPPTGIEAAALDDEDPTLIKDATYHAWRAGIEAAPWFQALTADEKRNLIGLRVRWIWTHTQMREAPDVEEFRVYFQPDQVNVLQGQVTAVTPVGAAQCDLTTTIQGNRPANSFAGAWIRVSNEAFRIVSTQAGSPLRLRVSNIGPNEDVRPALNKFCSIVIPEGHPEFIDYTEARSWNERWAVVPHGDPRGVNEQHMASDALGRALSGTSASITDTRIDLDGAPDLSSLLAVGEQIVLDADQGRADKSYLIVRVDDAAKRVWVTRAPAAGASSSWRIVFPSRRYDVLLPVAGDVDHAGLPLATPLAKPIAYAQISVSAADGKAYVKDTRTTGRLANRSGNEGPVGAKATIFRVRRDPPPPPSLPAFDSDLLWATRADYLSHSFFTFRWVPSPDVKTHVLRALDESVFDADWEKPVSERIQLDPLNNASHRGHFPAAAAEPRWDDARCQQVASTINAINALKTSGATLAAALAAYRALDNDALRVLAGLPGNERAFSQITIQPLDSNDPALADRRGPDSPDSYVANAALRAFQDTLDGRSSNRYFYRAGSVDGAHNRSVQLSASTPPVVCPDVVPPLAPSITKVLGGDQQIVIRWASNREPDLASYQVYRCDTEADARDVRLMTKVGELAVPSGLHFDRPPEITWTDCNVTALVFWFYRVVAVDTVGNVSEPSQVIRGRAFDESLPAVPALTVQWTSSAPPANAQVSWTTTDQSVLEFRGATEVIWASAGAWLAPGTHSLTMELSPHHAWRFRVRVRRTTGALAVGSPTNLPALV